MQLFRCPEYDLDHAEGGLPAGGAGHGNNFASQMIGGEKQLRCREGRATAFLQISGPRR
jgi:hypothetical protein